ncbi:hypothetical protein ACL03H_00605 [Saccharopolyspora sp. MS10]|uniref:hypothetical protein n=1 Tax=Saccharopolyspora sp. MS10 TaxID=3385973 RepID=UPI00399F2904
MTTTSSARAASPSEGAFRRPRGRRGGGGPYVWGGTVCAGAVAEAWISPGQHGFALLALVLVGVAAVVAAAALLRR